MTVNVDQVSRQSTSLPRPSLSGDMDVVVAGGVENMSRVPMGSNYQGAVTSQKYMDLYEVINQGLSAERIADKWGITREDCDQFSVESHAEGNTCSKKKDILIVKLISVIGY